MAVGALYDMTVSYSTPGGAVLLTHGYQLTAGVIEDTSLQNMCVDFASDQVDELADALAIGCEVDQVRIDPITVESEVYGMLNLDGKIGEIAGDSLPTNVAAVISQLTDAPSSKHNGRMFIAGVSEANQGEGTMDAPQIALLQVFADAMLQTIVIASPQAATLTPVVISRFANGIPLNPFVPHAVIQNIVRANLRQQRRRTTARAGIS